MDYKNLFEKFNNGGKLLLPDTTVDFPSLEVNTIFFGSKFYILLLETALK